MPIKNESARNAISMKVRGRASSETLVSWDSSLSVLKGNIRKMRDRAKARWTALCWIPGSGRTPAE